MEIFRVIKFCSIGVLVFLLSACSSSQYAPVQELGYSSGQMSTASAPTSYQVKSGDTLFAIAWRFGWDYKKLAKANRIRSPYTIYVGQNIYFNAKNENKIKLNKSFNGVVNKPSSTSNEPTVSSISNSNKTIDKNSNALKNKNFNGHSSVKWQWPIKGKLIRSFSNKGNAFHGIDVSSSLGKSVKAASSGIIVYAGSGIQGYGNLVVVKHNDTYLSAYAYNSRILVVEGAQVSAGQIIAEVGKGPQLDPRLHFEIRKNGKPVNPLRYLPKL
ncbi:MAG: peptidoglycan DD-metalloendopeptidase family protein [Gammaproteobacteria bacterium]|nr:peptidoglycan DD-metalloendopeptidase family protein [Gammaproteobacteria bacterium]